MANLFDTYTQDSDATHEALAHTSEWGDRDAVHIVDVVIAMIEAEAWSFKGTKSDVFWGTHDTISEAVTEACTALGLSDEEFSPLIFSNGFEFEITLY